MSYKEKVQEVLGIEVDNPDYKYYYPSKERFLESMPYAPVRLVEIKLENGLVVAARRFNNANPENAYGEWKYLEEAEQE